MGALNIVIVFLLFWVFKFDLVFSYLYNKHLENNTVLRTFGVEASSSMYLNKIFDEKPTMLMNSGLLTTSIVWVQQIRGLLWQKQHCSLVIKKIYLYTHYSSTKYKEAQSRTIQYSNR